MTEIVVFGSGGRLGRKLCAALGDRVLDHGWNRTFVDVEKPDEIEKMIEAHVPDFVINCTAMNGLEACEADPARAMLVNAVAPMRMAKACAKIGAMFIHFSTDYVLKQQPDRLPFEKDVNQPESVYAISKLAGEAMIQVDGLYWMIFRIASLYSDDLAGILSPVSAFIAGQGRRSNPIKVLRQRTTPISARALTEFILHVIDTVETSRMLFALTGIYHVGSSDPVWKTDFGRVAVQHFLNGEPFPVIVEGSLPLHRPVFGGLNTTVTAMTFDWTFPSFRADLVTEAQAYKAKIIST